MVNIRATGFDIKVPALYPKNTRTVLTLDDVRNFTGLDYVDSSHVTLIVAMLLLTPAYYFDNRPVTLTINILL